MADFSALIKRSSTADLERLNKVVESQTKRQTYEDDRFWYPKLDKAKNGYGVIRFLPESKNDDTPWVRNWRHSFQGPTGQWYIENCSTTLNMPCPVCASNKELWNTGTEANKKIVNARKRKINYYSNVYVVSDKQSPECQGNVYIFKYGQKIYEKIQSAMCPEGPDADEPKINPFHLLEGANFKLKIRTVDGYTNYDSSTFDAVSAIANDEAKIKEIWDKCYSLKEFVDPSLFKSEDKLKERLMMVLGAKTKVMVTKPEAIEDPVDAVVKSSTTEEVSSSESDEAFAQFDKLVND